MERLINKLKTIFILCLVFSCVVFFNTDYVQAREIGQGNVNNYLEGEDSKYELKDIMAQLSRQKFDVFIMN